VLVWLGLWLRVEAVLDSGSFLTPSLDRASEYVSEEVSEWTSEGVGLMDRESFLVDTVMVMKMGRSRAVSSKGVGEGVSEWESDGERETVAMTMTERVSETVTNQNKINENFIFQKAMIAITLHHYSTALHHLYTLVAHNPTNSNYHFNLGVVYQESGDLQRAMSAYHYSLQLKPNETRALLNFGVVAQQLGDFEMAVRLYR
jgi:Flp pilus assembly protein TadD